MSHDRCGKKKEGNPQYVIHSSDKSLRNKQRNKLFDDKQISTDVEEVLRERKTFLVAAVKHLPHNKRSDQLLIGNKTLNIEGELECDSIKYASKINMVYYVNC